MEQEDRDVMLKFEQDGTLPGGEKSYRLVIDGETTAEGLSLDQVIAAINRRDEEKLGEDHGPENADCHANAAALARNDGGPAERRRKAALGPFRRR